MINPDVLDWSQFFTPSSAANDDIVFFERRKGTGAIMGSLRTFLHRLRPLAKRAGQAGWQAAKKGAKAAVSRGARMAKEEAINTGRAVLDDLSKDQPLTHVVRDRAREGALRFAQRVRQGRGLGAINKKKKPALGILKSSRPTSGARRRLKPAIGK